jgi:hypothetical protein
MTLDDSILCPGRSDMGRLLGECSACTRRDASAPVSNIPPLILLKTQGIEVCEGRRFHGSQTLLPVELSCPPTYGSFEPVSVIRRGDAK